MFLAPRRPMMGIGMLGGPAYTAARVRQNQHVATAPPPAPAPAAPPPVAPLVADLQHLGELRDRGILTTAEFESAKRRLLAD
jgi:hypothetical protein